MKIQNPVDAMTALRYKRHRECVTSLDVSLEIAKSVTDINYQ
jgi:hypothetical protein